jgi:gamma-glutamyl-gamma-aminobutyrate hydrolase PuuD
MRIAISQRVDFLPDRGETRDALDQRLATLLAQAGLIPLPVPNSLDAAARDAWLATIDPAGVVLSGGNDIGQVPARDATETALLDFARARKLPTLGICRGMQMMAHIAGGRLARAAGHVRTRHNLIGTDARNVNSFHDWALADCPPGYSVTARSEDDRIEAIRHVTLPWRGWMWHPEREVTFNVHDLADIRELFGAPGAT